VNGSFKFLVVHGGITRESRMALWHYGIYERRQEWAIICFGNKKASKILNRPKNANNQERIRSFHLTFKAVSFVKR